MKTIKAIFAKNYSVELIEENNKFFIRVNGLQHTVPLSDYNVIAYMFDNVLLQIEGN